jgi:hypothetical protein
LLRPAGAVGDYVEVEDVVAVEEHDLAAFGGVQVVADPVACRLGDFAASDATGGPGVGFTPVPA